MSRPRAAGGPIVAALAAATITACHAAPAPPERPDPLWAQAELIVGDGGGHLPLPAIAMVGLDDRRALAILDDGGLARVDLIAGEATARARAALDGTPRAAALLADGRVLAVGGGAHGERAWSIDAEHLVAHALDVGGASGGDAVHDAGGVAASHDGHAVVITGVRLPLALRDPRDLSVVRELSPERNWSHPAFVGDAYLVATHHGDLVAYDLSTGREAGRWHTSTGFASPDGLALVHPPDLVHLELTDLHNPGYRIALASQDPIDAIWSPDGRHVVVVDPDRVIVYDIPDGDSHLVAVPGSIARAAFSSDGRRLIVTADGALWRVDPDSGRAAGPRGPGAGAVAFVAPVPGGLVMQSDRWRAIDRRGVRASGAWRGVADGGAFAISPDGARVAATSIGGDEAFVEEWDARSGRTILSALSDDKLLAVDVADDGAIVAATPDGLERLAVDGSGQPLAGARWAPPLDLAGGRVVYGRAGAIAVTDLHAGRAALAINAFDCDGDARARLSRDGARLAVIAGDRVAMIAIDRADVRTARMPGPVRALAIDAHGVIAATRDRVILWDGSSDQALELAAPAAVTAIGIDAGGRVALGFGDGRAGVWRIEALRALAKPRALRNAGALPATCPAGDPLAPASGDDVGARRLQRLPSP